LRFQANGAGSSHLTIAASSARTDTAATASRIFERFDRDGTLRLRFYHSSAGFEAMIWGYKSRRSRKDSLVGRLAIGIHVKGV
jgi:hypothetical protein